MIDKWTNIDVLRYIVRNDKGAAVAGFENKVAAQWYVKKMREAGSKVKLVIVDQEKRLMAVNETLSKVEALLSTAKELVDD